MSAYRRAAKGAMDEELYWPRWKYILISSVWGLVGVGITTLAFWLQSPSGPPMCREELISLGDVVATNSTETCPKGSHYGGSKVFYDDSNNPQTVLLCSCSRHKTDFSMEPDASVGK